ncbi:MAG TPA: tetratricopeptide repeat protein [Ignavibacteria bacterium]
MKGEFSKQTVRILAKRAGEKCSKCKKTTSKPNSSIEDFINLGEAAHIKGNNPGKNTRYDINIIDEERSHISNAIWLCPACHKEIDSDENIYTVDYLIELKRNHERDIHLCKYDLNYLPIIDNLNKEINNLKNIISDKETIIIRTERLFDYELNSLKDKLSKLENEKNAQIEKAKNTIDSLLKLDIDEDSELSNKVLELFKSGQLDVAIELLNDEKLYKKEKSIASLRLAKANLCNFNNDYENALYNFQKAIDICCEYEFYQPFIAFLSNYYKFIEIINLCKMLLEKEHNDNFRSYIFGIMGETFISLDDLESSIDNFKKSLEIIKTLPNQETKENKLNRARVLKSVGAAYRLLGKYEDSKIYFEDSLNLYFQISIKYGKTYTDELIGLYCNIGNLYNDAGFPKEALKYLLKAYIAFDETDLKDILLKSIVCINIKNSYFHPNLFNIKEAKKYIKEVISLLFEYSEKSPYEALEKLTIALTSFGDILMIEKDYKEAEKNYTKALDFAKQLYTVNKIHFASTLSAVYNNTSVFYSMKVDINKAIKFNNKAIKILETLCDNNQVNKINIAKILMFKCEFLLKEKDDKRKIAQKVIEILNTCSSNQYCNILKEKAQLYLN